MLASPPKSSQAEVKSLFRLRLLVILFITSLLLFFRATIDVLALSLDPLWHTVLDSISVLAALVIGAISLMRFFVRRNAVFMWIGTGFLGAAALDTYHIVVTRAPDLIGYSEAALRANWSALASSIFLSLWLLISWAAWLRQTSRPGSRRMRAPFIFALVVGICAVILSVFSFAELPSSFYPASPIPRPQELVAAALFAAALVGYLLKRQWHKTSFDFWLVLSIIFLTVNALFFAPFVGPTQDSLFFAVQLLKNLAYGLVFVGLLTSMYKVFRSAEQRRQLLIRQNQDLAKERQRAQRSLSVIQTTDWELNKKIKELEATKRTTLSVLKDLDQERHKLTTAKARDEAILASIGEGLVVVDQQRAVTYVNAAAVRLTGYPRKELLGKKWPDVMRPQNQHDQPSPKDKMPTETAIEQHALVSTREPISYMRKDGNLLPVAITSAPIILEGNTIGAITVFRDFTREREIDKAKTEFVSLASHQLRTPLSTVNWYAEMLLDGDAGKLNAEQRDYLLEVTRANHRMIDLVNALLNVSRIELGTFSVKPEAIDLTHVANTVVKELKPQAEQKHLKVKAEFDENIPILQADPNLVRIVFQNLLSNAVKYTPEKGEVEFKMSRVKSGAEIAGKKATKACVVIEVTDNGYGIPKEAQDNIFKKMYRADNVKSKEVDGNGLGLYIVKSIVEHSKGEVWFESEENKGSRFFVTLPCTGMEERKGSRTLG